MHRRIIEPILKTLSGERAVYFTDVISKIEEDPRSARYPNVVFLLLKETIRELPIHLSKDELVTQVFVFIEKHIRDFEHVVFDKDYIYDQTIVKKITNQFILAMVTLTLEHYQNGEIETGEPAQQKFTFPYRAEDLIDPEDDEALDDLQKRPAYTGPERRKNR